MRTFPDFKQYCEAACFKLWGEPDERTSTELRWNGGGAGSERTFDLPGKRWYDHGQKRGGSTLELVAYARSEPAYPLRGALFFETWREAYEMGLIPEGPKAVDMAAARAALESAAKDKVVELFIELALSGDLNPVELDTLLRLAAERSGERLRPLGKLLKQAQDEQAKQRAEQAARRAAAARAKRRAERTDPRPMVCVPAYSDPWIPVMDKINAVVGVSQKTVPPARDIDRVATRLRKLSVPKMHAFDQTQANPGDDDYD